MKMLPCAAQWIARFGLLCALFGCTAADLREAMEPEPQPKPVAGEVFVFDCPEGGPRVVVQVAGETAWLMLPERTVALGRVPSASGAKFVGGEILFWNSGEEALLEMDGNTWRGCRFRPAEAVREAAKLRGVAFRAVGNEPGWRLEVIPDEWIEFVPDPGERKYAFRPLAPLQDPVTGAIVLRGAGAGNDLRVDIREETCIDGLSGQRFEHRVTVSLDGKTYRGCGRMVSEFP